MAQEDNLEDEGIEEHHSDTMPMDFEEELRLLEEWLEKPKGEVNYITIADKKHPRMLSCNMVKGEIEDQDIGLSCEVEILLHTQQKYADQRIVLRGNKENENNQEIAKDNS
jgi:hypothetical protein